MNVCFVCYGNICRSPTAEIIFYNLVKEAGLSDHIRVTSAGIGAMRGQPLYPGSAEAMRRHGYNNLTHSSRQFWPSWFNACDLVLASDESVAQTLRNFARNDEERSRVVLLAGRDIPNPWGGATEDYEAVFQIIDGACRDLLLALDVQIT